MLSSFRRAAVLGAIVICCVSCDQATKSLATTALAGRPPISLLGDTIRLSYIENPGGFLSIGAGLPAGTREWVFAGLGAVVVTALLTVAVSGRSLGRLQLVAISLLIAGGVGNIVDRTAYGVVRDFLNVGVGTVRAGIFNVADLALTVGSALLAIRFWRERVR